MTLPKLYLEYKIKKDNKIIERKKITSKSWTGNILRWLYTIINEAYTGTTSGSGYEGDIRPIRRDNTNLVIKAISFLARSLIDVGNDNTPVNLLQYNLLNPIPDTILQRGTPNYSSVTITTTLAKFDIMQTFTNISNNNVNIREVGLKTNIAGNTFMYARDIVNITLAPSANVTFKYTVLHQL